MKRKGWFIIPGLQDGDRTLEEQVLALGPAIAECNGKSVLDLGCAEGLISIEFARAGAREVLGMESVAEHLAVARRLARGMPIRFELANLQQERAEKVRQRFDIVLALGVLHKLRFPEPGLRWAAASCASLLLLRSGRAERDGRIWSKHFLNNYVERDKVLDELGFVLERTVAGPTERLEDVQYWRRK